MTKEKSALQQVEDLKDKLPKEVREDIEQRLVDWFSGDHERSENDNYVKQQLRYAKNVLNQRTL